HGASPMNENRLADYLTHIRDAASDARAFVHGMTKEAFLGDRRTQRAVIMSLVIVGEAATKTMERYPDFVTSNPDLPWRGMRGMRNRVAHGYFDLNLDVIWDTVESALPALLAQIGKLDAGA